MEAEFFKLMNGGLKTSVNLTEMMERNWILNN